MLQLQKAQRSSQSTSMMKTNKFNTKNHCINICRLCILFVIYIKVFNNYITKMKYRNFQISATLFWGWQSCIDIDEYNTIEAIVNKVKIDLKKYLKNANLLELVTKVDEMKLHTHEDLNKIFNNKEYENSLFYLCDHC